MRPSSPPSIGPLIRRARRPAAAVAAEDGAPLSSADDPPSASAAQQAPLDPAEVAAWLRQYATPFSQLTPRSLGLFAALLREERAPGASRLERAGSAANRVIVVRQGCVRVSVPPAGRGKGGSDDDDDDDDGDGDYDYEGSQGESDPQQPSSPSSPSPAAATAFAASARAGPGAVLGLSAVLLKQPAPSDVRANGDCVLWAAPAEDVRAMAAAHPEAALELGLRLSLSLSARANEAEAELEAEQARQRVLAPFRVAQPRSGVVGTSRYADALRRQIVTAARDRSRRPVYIFGEPGLHKDDLAALAHFGGVDRARPLIRIDCARYSSSGGGGAGGGGGDSIVDSGGLLLELFGRGSRGGLLHYLRDGALLLSNVQRLPAGVLPVLAELVRQGTYQPLPALAALAAASGGGGSAGGQSLSSLVLLAPPMRRSPARIIMTAAKQVPALAAAVNAAAPRAVVAAEEEEKVGTAAATAAAAPRPAAAAEPESFSSSSSAAVAKAAAAGPRALPQTPRVINVPPLRVRRADVIDIVRYQLRLLERTGGGPRLALSLGARNMLEAYAWPDNAAEVEVVIGRAVQQATSLAGGAAAAAAAAAAAGGGGAGRAASAAAGAGAGLLSSLRRGGQPPRPPPAVTLEPELFWGVAEDRDRLRLNLLSTVPRLRAFLRSRFWPDVFNADVVRPAFVAVVLLLFLGPQTRDANVALNFFWNGWWPLSFVAYLFLGRIWCSFCPFQVFGQLAQDLRVRAQGRGVLARWPRAELERYGGWFMLALFFAILVWEEGWDLPQNAALSSWLLLLITAGAIVGSFFFEKRVWCRYLCPIGAMNGAFAKMAMTEVRGKQGVCAASCTTYGCYRGQGEPEQWWSDENRAPVPIVVAPEGLADPGCPVGSHPAQLTDNRNCVLCMQCLKACPHRSVEFRFRPPGIDLWGPAGARHEAVAHEAAMVLMLLGAVYLHRLPALTVQLLGSDGGGGEGAAARLSALWPGAGPGAPAGPEAFYLAEPLRPALEWWMAHRPEHVAVSAAVLCAPGLLAWAVDAGQRLWSAAAQRRQAAAASRAVLVAAAASASSLGGGGGGAAAAVAMQQSPPQQLQQQRPPVPLPPFLELSYAYMPLTWAATLAHYEGQMLLELGRLLPVTAATFGAAEWGERFLPAVQADPAVVAFLQGATLAAGCGASLALGRRLAARPWIEIAPQVALTLGLTAELWRLIV